MTVVNRDGELRVEGEAEDTMLAGKGHPGPADPLPPGGSPSGSRTSAMSSAWCAAGGRHRSRSSPATCCASAAKGRPIKPKTIGQKEYIRSVLKNTVTIGVGPAGTGKTYLAVAAAVQAFRDKQVNRIILTRPAVEAGERLGFLPGDLQSKVDPYLRPLYDALFDMLGAETYQKYLERGNIEVAPLAYMRGRTLDDSFIILDEAQNTSREQMKMFLTRLGFGSKIVITGDVTQIDLPDGKASGLKEAMRVLRDVEGIGICELTNADVVRHVMVQRIVEAYERYETAKKRRKGAEVMAKRHYIPVTADVPGAASQGNCALIRKVIRTALAAEGVDFPCEVDVLLTDDSGIHAINREMRQVDRPTDVLSFPEFDLTPGQLPGAEDADPGTGLVPLGDMVISMERVAAQAREYNHSKRRELSYLVVHSVLHLLGYDHLDEGPQKARMRAREEAILGELGIGR